MTVKGSATATGQKTIKDIKFRLTEGSSTLVKLLLDSGPVIPVESGGVFTSTWDFIFPSNVQPGSTYRIFASVNCTDKTTAMVNNANQNVLAATTKPQQGFFASIFSFFASLFGGSPSQPTVSVQSVPPTATPTLTDDARNSLQLKTLLHGKITKEYPLKACPVLRVDF